MRPRNWISVQKDPVRIAYSIRGQDDPMLEDRNGVSWNNGTITADFNPVSGEHFAGLGHTV